MHTAAQVSNLRMGPFTHVQVGCTTAYRQVEDGSGEEVQVVALDSCITITAALAVLIVQACVGLHIFSYSQ